MDNVRELPKKIVLTIQPPADGLAIGVAQRITPIFEAILREREFQNKKYGPILVPAAYLGKGDVAPGCPMEQGPGGHELGTWSIILESELAEYKRALVHGGSKNGKDRDTARAELVQIAAVAIAALEQHGLEEPK